MEQGITCFVFCFLFVVVVLCGWLVSWLVVYFSATHGVVRKKNSRRLNHARNIFRKNLQLIGAVCQMVVKQKIEKKNWLPMKECQELTNLAKKLQKWHFYKELYKSKTLKGWWVNKTIVPLITLYSFINSSVNDIDSLGFASGPWKPWKAWKMKWLPWMTLKC